MVRKRRIYMDKVDRGIGENVLKALVARLDPKGVANRVERGARSAANGVHVRRRMPLVDRYELYTEAKPDNGDGRAVNLASSRREASALAGRPAYQTFARVALFAHVGCHSLSGSRLSRCTASDRSQRSKNGPIGSNEALRVDRRLFRLSHAAMGGSSSMA